MKKYLVLIMMGLNFGLFAGDYAWNNLMDLSIEKFIEESSTSRQEQFFYTEEQWNNLTQQGTVSLKSADSLVNIVASPLAQTNFWKEHPVNNDGLRTMNTEELEKNWVRMNYTAESLLPNEIVVIQHQNSTPVIGIALNKIGFAWQVQVSGKKIIDVVPTDRLHILKATPVIIGKNLKVSVISEEIPQKEVDLDELLLGEPAQVRFHGATLEHLDKPTEMAPGVTVTPAPLKPIETLKIHGEEGTTIETEPSTETEEYFQPSAMPSRISYQ